jgi:hypothetical protein
MPFDEFATMVREEWRKLDWALPGVHIQQRNGNCTGYSLKEGFGTFLV